MSQVRRVVWSEGMLMSPQHFQQQDRYHEALLEARVAAVSRHAWGVSKLALDPRALEAGQVALLCFAGVLPRGAVLRFEAGDAEAPPARAIGEHFSAHDERLDVYLGLPLERAGCAVYARSEGERGRARFVIETRPVPDAVSAGQEEALELARLSPMLLLGDEARDDFEALKIAEIVRDASGKLCLDGRYVPPCLRLSAAPSVLEGARQVLATSIAKRRAIARELRQRDESVEFAADEVTRYLALHALSGAIASLTHLVDGRATTPYDAYLTLTQLAGQLTAFSADEDPSALPRYVHTDLRATFDGLFAKLTALLQVAVAARVIAIPLEARVDGMHLARLQASDALDAGARVLLSVSSEVPEQTVYDLMPRVSKVASWTEIPRYLSAAATAAPLSVCTKPPREVPVRPGKCYFAVSTDGPAWRGIASERTIAVHLPPPFEPRTTVLELLVIPAV